MSINPLPTIDESLLFNINSKITTINKKTQNEISVNKVLLCCLCEDEMSAGMKCHICHMSMHDTCCDELGFVRTPIKLHKNTQSKIKKWICAICSIKKSQKVFFCTFFS